MAKKKKIPELKIVFDTSALFTGSASDLLNLELIEIITEHSKHIDLSVYWYIPNIVLMERKYQMQKKGFELLPHIQKLEKLLGHNLNITEDIIEKRVDDAIEKNISSLNIKRIEVDTTKIKWEDVIHKSLFRKPPFEEGEKEKGFRDAIIAESFYQLIENSPKTPKVCRLVFVTKDGLLADTVEHNTQSNENIRVVRNLEDLKGLINTLVSEVDEEFVSAIREKAKNYFFQVNDVKTLLFKEDIQKILSDKYVNELKNKPEDSSLRENGTWYVGKPNFVKKVGQRIHWSTKINVESKAYYYKYDPSTPQPASGSLLGLMQKQLTPEQNQLNLISSLLSSPSKELNHKGATVFEIIWSVSVSTSRTFSNPKIESMNYIETIWENA